MTRQAVKIRGLKLPDRLVADLEGDGLALSPSGYMGLVQKIRFFDGPRRIRFHGMASVEQDSEFLDSEDMVFYLGKESPLHPPGDIDPTAAVLIGEVDPDSPIALDYRTSEPRVIYLGSVENVSQWFELSDSYEALVDELSACSVPPPEVPSPKVQHIEWGQVQVEGHGAFKDVKLYPGGARAWDWNETGTRHDPGVQIADVAELIEHGCDHLVLSRGMQLRLQVQLGTAGALRTAGLTVHVEETKTAVEVYNELAAEGKAVGALLHSTC